MPDIRSGGRDETSFNPFAKEQPRQPWNCPNGFALVDHYSSDGKTCHCFDRGQRYLGEYGYRWSDREGRWVGQQAA